MNKDKITFFLLLVALFALLTYLHAVIKETIESPFDDFAHYWLAASLLKEGYSVWGWNSQTQERNIEIAQENNINSTIPQLHSPVFFLFILPLTVFPFRVAILLWLILGHLFLFYSIWLILKTFRARPSLEDLFMVLFLVFSFWPLREQLHQGNPNFLTLFFLTASLFLLKKGYLFFGAGLLGLAIQTREYLAVTVLFFLLQRRWRVLIGIIIGFLLLKAVAIFTYGLAIEISYWKHIGNILCSQLEFSPTNHNLFGMIFLIGNDLFGLPVCFGVWLFSIAFFIGMAFFWTRSKVDLLLGFSLFLVLSFLLSPQVHESHYLVLYPVFIMAWFKLEKEYFLQGLFISAYLLLGLGYSLERFPNFNSGLLAILSTGKLIGIIILFFLLLRIIQKERLIKSSLPRIN